ncbi:MAG: DUF177 domain-containing protein [Microscillaceae bacterium]|nr:DUF177 domain-containing protein [Microscillaceae bacterium]
MDKLEDYSISIANLKNQEYPYQFTIDKGFFDLFDYGLVQNGELTVDLNLIKSDTLIQLFFTIQGYVWLVCDRSLEEFEYPLYVQEKLILKFGEENAQISEELELISRNTLEINIAQYLYEFIGISIPMKKLHPRFQTEEDDSESDSVLVYSSVEVDPNTSEELEDDQNQEVDPRWQILKKLKK